MSRVDLLKQKREEYEQQLNSADFEYQEVLAKRSHLRKMIRMIDDQLSDLDGSKGSEELAAAQAAAGPTRPAPATADGSVVPGAGPAPSAAPTQTKPAPSSQQARPEAHGE